MRVVDEIRRQEERRADQGRDHHVAVGDGPPRPDQHVRRDQQDGGGGVERGVERREVLDVQHGGGVFPLGAPASRRPAYLASFKSGVSRPAGRRRSQGEAYLVPTGAGAGVAAGTATAVGAGAGASAAGFGAVSSSHFAKSASLSTV